MLNNASIAQLRMFMTVAQLGGIKPAAEQVGRTQSAVSMALRQLEQQIGTPLFDGERKMHLSKAGQFALDQIGAVLEHYDRAWSAISAFAQNQVGRIDVASVPSVATTLLPEAIQRLQKVSTELDIDIRDMDSRSVAEAVQKNIAEIGFGTVDRTLPGLTVSPLLYDNLSLVVAAKDPLARISRPIKWADLKGRTLLANAVCENIKSEEFQEIFKATKLHIYNVASLMALVGANVGVTVLPRLSKPKHDKSIKFLPIADETARREVSLIVKSEQRLSPAGEVFVRTVKEVVKQSAHVLGIRIAAA